MDMILEIEDYKGDVCLAGKNIAENDLKKQLEYVQNNYDRAEDNFIEFLCRCFNWEISYYIDIPDYTYDRDIERLKKKGC